MSHAIRRIPLPEWIDPEEAFTTLFATETHAFWLDAGAGATVGMSYQGAASGSSRFVEAAVDGSGGARLTVSRPADLATAVMHPADSLFDFLRADLGMTRSVPASPSRPGPPSFELGWVGWFGYELGAQVLGVPGHESRVPDAALLDVDRMLAFDHAARTVTLVLRETADPEQTAEAELWVAGVRDRLAGRTSADTDTAPVDGRAASVQTHGPRVTWRHSAADYADLIRQAQDQIRAGNAYQLCLTNEIRVAARPDPLATYLELRRSSPSHHGGLLNFGEYALLSATPEQFLSITPTGQAHTKPIKGTRPRSADVAEDARLAVELLANEKERAENLMIVDLMRNDLGRVARLGSVQVTELLAVESYPHVHQLVSTVSAILADGLTALDLIEAAFPAGSMTGAPKLGAMTILHGLEAGPRGVYAGVFGYLSRDGGLDLAMVIRSIVLEPDGASIGTGGGITALSEPEAEIEETLIKARALAAVLGVSESELATALGQGLVT